MHSIIYKNMVYLKDINSYFRSSAYDFRLRANLQNVYLKNAELSARFSQLENHQPNVAEFRSGESLDSMAIHSLKITRDVSILFKLLRATYYVYIDYLECHDFL